MVLFSSLVGYAREGDVPDATYGGETDYKLLLLLL
jgi:hypothetical protein